MHLLPGELVFGVAPALLVDTAKQIHDRGEGLRRPLDLDRFSMALGAPRSEALPVLLAMAEAGYFTQVADTLDRFIPTKKLAQLAQAKISHGIQRSEADALLARVVERAQQINQSPGPQRYRIGCLAVFGSWLGSTPVLGDLDIAARLVEIPGTERNGWQDEPIWLWASRNASERSKVFSSLRLRQPLKISVHDLQEVIELGTPYRVLLGSVA